MASKSKLHVAIVGAGLGGLAAAISISLSGHRATILEQASELGEVGAGIQIPPNSSCILRQLGVLPQIEALSTKLNSFVLRSYQDGRTLSKQPTSPYCEETYGAPYLLIHRADYHRVLVSRARELGVRIILGSRVSGVDFDAPAVKFANGTFFKADVVIGADGLKSVCREALLGRRDPPRLTGDLAYRITVPASKMREKECLRELVESPAINYWLGPDSHVVGYLLKGGDLYNMVLACPDNLPELVNTEKADLREMREIFSNWDPRLKALLELVQETSKWRLMNSEEMAHWGNEGGKFVLLGDACHATLPYLASGAAMAIEDGFLLGKLLSRTPASIKPNLLADILTLYESLRKSRTTQVVKQSSHYQQIFHMHDGPAQEERDIQLIEYDSEPYEGYPNKWRDPVFQNWLWGYDVQEVVDVAWERYLRGQFPLTRGGWRTLLPERTEVRRQRVLIEGRL